MSAEHSAREVALGLLARREHSALELRQKLRQRGYSEDVIAPLLEDLVAQDWLSDLRFAEGFLRSRIDKGHGPLRIRADLAQKGVAPALIDLAMESEAVDWMDVARARIRKRFKAGPVDARERARRYRHLYAQGFPADIARRVSAMTIDNDDD